MPMTAMGLAKLIEESGEVLKAFGGLIQVLGKKLAYYHTDEHPDGTSSLKKRLEDEIGDVLGACEFVIETHGLDTNVIQARAELKLKRFQEWHARADNNKDGVDRLPCLCSDDGVMSVSTGCPLHDPKHPHYRRS